MCSAEPVTEHIWMCCGPNALWARLNELRTRQIFSARVHTLPSICWKAPSGCCVMADVVGGSHDYHLIDVSDKEIQSRAKELVNRLHANKIRELDEQIATISWP